MKKKITRSDTQWREQLTPEEYEICRNKGTERAFTGAYWDCKDEGTYRCRACDEPLFSSSTKYDSGTGWPSFWEPTAEDSVEVHADHSHGMVREEVVCASCGSHLGHRFPDGPRPTGTRYCINSASLKLEKSDE